MCPLRLHATCESLRDNKQASKLACLFACAKHASTQANKQAVCVSCGSGWSVLCVSIQLTLSLFRKRSVCSSCPPRAGHGGQVVVVNSCSGARGSQLYELPAWGPIDDKCGWTYSWDGGGGRILENPLARCVSPPSDATAAPVCVSCCCGRSVPCARARRVCVDSTYRYVERAGVCCWWVWMAVRFVCVVRVPSCVCPGSPRCLFTGTRCLFTGTLSTLSHCS